MEASLYIWGVPQLAASYTLKSYRVAGDPSIAMEGFSNMAGELPCRQDPHALSPSRGVELTRESGRAAREEAWREQPVTMAKACSRFSHSGATAMSEQR